MKGQRKPRLGCEDGQTMGYLRPRFGKTMTPEEAIKALEKMQSQIVHGSRIFADIADVIRALANPKWCKVCGFQLKIGNTTGYCSIHQPKP